MPRRQVSIKPITQFDGNKNQGGLRIIAIFHFSARLANKKLTNIFYDWLKRWILQVCKSFFMINLGILAKLAWAEWVGLINPASYGELLVTWSMRACAGTQCSVLLHTTRTWNLSSAFVTCATMRARVSKRSSLGTIKSSLVSRISRFLYRSTLIG